MESELRSEKRNVRCCEDATPTPAKAIAAAVAAVAATGWHRLCVSIIAAIAATCHIRGLVCRR